MLRTALTIGLIAAVLPCAAQSPDRVVVVLDASERMARPGPGGVEIGGMVGPALVLAVGAVSENGPAMEVGLRTAGGTAATPESNPCSATTQVLPVGEPDPERWTEALAALEWSGPCPLVDATVAAVGDLGSAAGPLRIVVISAGGDDCDTATADVAEALASTDPPIEVRLVGLGLKPEVLERFAGISQRNATSESDLAAALRWALSDAGRDDEETAEPPQPSAAVAAPPRVGVGSSITVDWSGPERDEDFISVARAEAEGTDYVSWVRTEAGAPSTLDGPREAGEYEVRYVDGETGEVLARSPIVVAASAIGLVAPSVAAAGRRVTIRWEGPGAVGDIVAMSRPDAPADRILDWATTATGSPVTLAVPDRPGTYEIRYITALGTEIAARVEIEVHR
jgi:hypothetical protein